MRIDLKSIVEQGKQHVSAEVDGEVVMMSIEKGNYYGIDAVGARIWQIITEPHRVAEVCNQLMTEFDVDRATCEVDTLDFLNRLMAEDLIVVRSEPDQTE